MPALLELAELRAGYGRIAVLQGIDLTVPEGSVVAVLGSNGVGKTTLLRTIAGVLAPTGGTVRFAGDRIEGLPTDRIAARGLVMVPEGRGVFPGLDVEENLRLIHSGMGAGTAWREFFDEITTVFPILGQRRGQRAGSLSGGEQQMLALSRAMVGSPRLVLFDELSMGLAPLIVEELFEHVRAMRDHGMTIVLVEQFLTHALALADVCYVMAKGRVSWAGEPSEIRAGAATNLGI